MNHTDDDQPLGEAPIIEMSMAELADRIDVQADRSQRQAVALNKIAELHCEQFDRTLDEDGNPGTYCEHCNIGPYPCPTRQIIDEAGVL